MAFVLAGSLEWHRGEEKMHKLMGASHDGNPTAPYLSPGAASLIQRCPLLVLGTLDKDGLPWTTVWGGQAGFAGPIAQSVIGINVAIGGAFDPVAETLLGGEKIGQIVKEEDGKGRLMSGLPVDFENRKRVKLMGRMVAGTMRGNDTENNDGNVSKTGHSHIQLAMQIDSSMGNCPKYLNKRHIIPNTPQPKLISDSPQLPQQAIDLLSRIDTLFVSSSHEQRSMDSNLRGGPPGFIRVLSNNPTGAVIVYPEYSGNRLYQTIGNLQTTPFAGYAFPDFDTGDILFATGKTEVLVGKEAADLLPRSNLAVKVTITAARYVEDGLTFRGEPGEPSPYNPPVRYLVSEKVTPGTRLSESLRTRVSLVKKEFITPSINRFRFKTSDHSVLPKWKPGQYATFSFRDELYMGYSHMKDDDPMSINDDYIRTFTIASHPGRNLAQNEFEIIARKKGNATSHLFRSNDRGGMELSLCGFDGNFQFAGATIDPDNNNGGDSLPVIPFIAGGIGITPVISQLPYIDVSRLRLFWSISIKDIGLVKDVFDQFPGLPEQTILFITSSSGDSELMIKEGDTIKLKAVSDSGVKIERRRLLHDDIRSLSDIETWYLCAGPGLKAAATNWLTGKKLVYEDFSY
ncbi:hypothetical protein FQN57_004016 [Myotisia sp. PD_48]|nr:hypothetical protein FQN57_004016 [Myotisia sp. PD_48]